MLCGRPSRRHASHAVGSGMCVVVCVCVVCVCVCVVVGVCVGGEDVCVGVGRMWFVMILCVDVEGMVAVHM